MEPEDLILARTDADQDALLVPVAPELADRLRELDDLGWRSLANGIAAELTVAAAMARRHRR